MKINQTNQTTAMAIIHRDLETEKYNITAETNIKQDIIQNVSVSITAKQAVVDPNRGYMHLARADWSAQSAQTTYYFNDSIKATERIELSEIFDEVFTVAKSNE